MSDFGSALMHAACIWIECGKPPLGRRSLAKHSALQTGSVNSCRNVHASSEGKRQPLPSLWRRCHNRLKYGSRPASLDILYTPLDALADVARTGPTPPPTPLV